MFKMFLIGMYEKLPALTTSITFYLVQNMAHVQKDASVDVIHKRYFFFERNMFKRSISKVLFKWKGPLKKRKLGQKKWPRKSLIYDCNFAFKLRQSFFNFLLFTDGSKYSSLF